MSNDVRILMQTSLLLLLLTGALPGCQRAKESPPPAPVVEEPRRMISDVVEPVPETIPVEPPTTILRETPPPVPAGLSTGDLRKLLDEQRTRTEETNRELAAARDPETIRQILLRRKGEILKAQKTIRQSDQMTPAQKDSLLLPLEQESIRISTRLMNTPR